METIGILGGMGPSASADFYSRIIRIFQERHGAVQDTDYPPMFIYSLPLKGFNETGIVDKGLVLTQLTEGAKRLANARLRIHSNCV